VGTADYWRLAGRFTIRGFEDSRFKNSRIQKIKGVEGFDWKIISEYNKQNTKGDKKVSPY
jgi:hypothetical protein